MIPLFFLEIEVKNSEYDKWRFYNFIMYWARQQHHTSICKLKVFFYCRFSLSKRTRGLKFLHMLGTSLQSYTIESRIEAHLCDLHFKTRKPSLFSENCLSWWELIKFPPPKFKKKMMIKKNTTTCVCSRNTIDRGCMENQVNTTISTKA